MKKYKGFSWLGYLIFFITVFFAVTVAIAIYVEAINTFPNSKGKVALIMLLTIAFISLTCTVIDVFRRKLMVERPTERILNATRQMAQGDYTVKLEIKHPYGHYDEYDLIFDNLNKLGDELSKTEVLSKDFLSNVSHELKTPLAVIQSYATALNNPRLSAEDRSQYSAVLVETSKKLTALVTNVLKLNKLENQKSVPKSELIDLEDMLANCIIGYEGAFLQKEIEVFCDFDKVNVVSDVDLLEIVWNNLLSNAVKFTDNGGKIHVLLKKERGYALVTIKDTGCGIPSATGQRIFDKFYQGDGSHSEEGNGLGLALVKKVIDILGGKISVESQVGVGTSFTVRLSIDGQ